MKLFKTFTLTWWQGGLFKWGVLLLSIAIGACWPGVFHPYAPLLVIVSGLFLSYITCIWWKQ